MYFSLITKKEERGENVVKDSVNRGRVFHCSLKVAVQIKRDKHWTKHDELLAQMLRGHWRLARFHEVKKDFAAEVLYLSSRRGSRYY